MGVPVGAVDVAAAWEEINDIQIDLPTKKLALELHPTFRYPKWICHFSIVNNGNRDVEPLEVTVGIPSGILDSAYNPVIDAAILEVSHEAIDGIPYTMATYRNHREPIQPERIGRKERLVKCLAPGMRSNLQHLFFEVRYPLNEDELANPIRFRILAKNVKPVERTITLKDKLIVGKS